MKLFRWLVVVVILLSQLVYGVAPSYACSCVSDPNLTEAEQLLQNFGRDYHKLVFVGTVQWQTQPPFWAIHRTGSTDVEFAVETVYKGRVTQRFTLSTADQGSACGYDFALGKRYLVFVGDDFHGGSWNSGLCSGNVLEPSADLLSHLPTSGYGPSVVGMVWLQLLSPVGWICVLSVLLGVGMVVYRRRRGKRADCRDEF